MNRLFKFYVLFILFFAFCGKQDIKAFNAEVLKSATVASVSTLSITGPDRLCLYYGSSIGDFFGGGLATDVFKWRVLASDGSVLIEKEGGFQTFSFTFSDSGTYIIELTVRRNVETVFEGSKSVVVEQGPSIVLQPSYLLCDDTGVTLTFLDSATPNIGNYTISWVDSKGATVGSGNSFTTNRADRYTVLIHANGPQGQQLCSFQTNVHVYQSVEFSVSLSENQVCDSGNAIVGKASNNVFGKWYFQKAGEATKKLLGEGNTIRFSSSGELEGPGDYTISFIADNNDLLLCELEDSAPLKILPSGDVAFEVITGADGCGINNGSIVVRALTDLSLLRVRFAGTTIFSRTNLLAGETVTIPNLRSGIYSVSGAIGACSRTRSTVVELKDPKELAFTIAGITGESCDASGIVNGKISIKMTNGPFTGSYRLFSNTGGVLQTVDINGLEAFDIETRAGNYFFDLINSSGCANPYKERITIPAIGQVVFTAPQRINVCKEYDFIPQTAQNLIFRLTYPNGQVVSKAKGEPFNLNQAGEYQLVGSGEDSALGLCPKELLFEVVLVPDFNFEPVLVSGDCFGNRVYKAELFGADISRYTIRWINEKQEVIGNGEFLFPTSHGELFLDVQPVNSEICPTPPKRFFVPPYIEDLQVNLSASAICPNDASLIRLEGDLRQVTTIKWIYYDALGNVNLLNAFENDEEVTVTEEGAYEAVLYNDIGCEIGRSLVQVQATYAIAEFELAESLLICESFDLRLPTAYNLVFLVTDPKGTTIEYVLGEAITLVEEGVYTIVASGIGDDAGLCPMTKQVQVSKKEAIVYDVQLVEENCEGELIYTAITSQIEKDELDIFWYDQSGELVGNGETFSPISNGSYSLEVRPKGALACPGTPKTFVVQLPEISISVSLNAGPFCPGDQPASISVIADFAKVASINWTFQDLLGKRFSLTQFTDVRQIEILEQGIYEVELLNSKGCIIGTDLVLMIKSIDDLQPNVDASYTFCAQKNQFLEINPGDFASYYWSLDGRMVSNQATFKPSQSGTYTLTVSNGIGCSNTVQFDVKENCELKVRFPNAFMPRDPKRNFAIYPDETVEEVEVLIYSKWGELMYSCSSILPVPGKPICQWDGLYNGNVIPAGNYAVKISYKLYFSQVRETAIATLTLIE
jgi:hypothetical protein